MPFNIIRNDITKMKVDAIVNATNSALEMGGGVCGAIFTAAGPEQLRDACRQLAPCTTGNAVITKGYALPAGYIIHTVGPVWSGGVNDEARLLRSCYASSLDLAQKYRCKSIAFPLVSSGIYGYPKDLALEIAVSEIKSYLKHHDMDVFLVVYDSDAFAVSSRLFDPIKQYIDDHYIEEHLTFIRGKSIRYEDAVQYSMAAPQPVQLSKLDDALGQLEETFSQRFMRLIDQKGYRDAEVYKKANLDRKLFSKIRSDKDYRPGKATALALAIALELDLAGTRDLLRRAGFALSHSNRFDIIVEYFIEHGNYDIYEINEALFAFDQKLLGV